MTIDFLIHSDNSTQVIEEEVAKVIVQLMADENHKFMRPHAGGINSNEVYEHIKSKQTQLASNLT